MQGQVGADAHQQALSEPLRRVVWLRFYADRSCAEIAQVLGTPLGTVMSN